MGIDQGFCLVFYPMKERAASMRTTPPSSSCLLATRFSFWPMWPADAFYTENLDEFRCSQGWSQAPSTSLANIERRGPKPLDSW
jgi:hypothetical protein